MLASRWQPALLELYVFADNFCETASGQAAIRAAFE
jgi:hypothetical protein